MLKLEVSLALFGFPAHFTYKSPNILPHIDLAAKVKLSYPPRDAGQSMLELTSKSQSPPLMFTAQWIPR